MLSPCLTVQGSAAHQNGHGHAAEPQAADRPVDEPQGQQPHGEVGCCGVVSWGVSWTLQGPVQLFIPAQPLMSDGLPGMRSGLLQSYACGLALILACSAVCLFPSPTCVGVCACVSPSAELAQAAAAATPLWAEAAAVAEGAVGAPCSSRGCVVCLCLCEVTWVEHRHHRDTRGVHSPLFTSSLKRKHAHARELPH
jgi:hypothetical protein